MGFSNILISISRITISFILIYAGSIKILDIEKSIQAVGAYQLVGPELARIFGTYLPVFEIVLGLLILFKILHPYVNYIAAGLMGVFIMIIISVWVRGLSIDCGCFGGGGELPSEGKEVRYLIDIVRDLAFLVLALISSRRYKNLSSSEADSAIAKLPELL